jgi:APA family basic amino acid/polyamine antiporter
MFTKQLFARKSLQVLEAEAAGENRLRRVLGPISLTSLGVGAIIGAGIFVMTGRAAAVDAGPAIVLSYVVAGIGCVFAAFCYAEFASMAPVAGSAYTYAYATLGELFAWIIGWDLILEYAMACAVVAAGWTHYLDSLLNTIFEVHLPVAIASDPFSKVGAWFNAPAVFIVLLCTIILVIGIRESATTNAILVGIKVGVVLFVIAVGAFYVNPANWNTIPPTARPLPEEQLIPDLAATYVKDHEHLKDKALAQRVEQLSAEALATYKIERTRQTLEEQERKGDVTPEQVRSVMEETRTQNTA